MDNKKDLVKTIQSKMTSFLESTPAKDVCRKVGIAAGLDAVVVFEAMIVAALLLIVLILGAEMVVNFACFLYPLLSSVRALERGATADKSQWITYWMTLFTFQTLESFMPRIFSAIPFFFWFKLGFLVWCYHPVTRGASVVYKLGEPIRDEIMPFLDALLEEIAPGSTKTSKPSTIAPEKPKDAEYVPSGITVHLESLVLPEEESEAADATPKALYVEIYLASAAEAGGEPKCVGAKYKTPPLTGSELNFNYKLTLIPPSDILNEAGATLCFTVKERMTFGDDPTVFNIHTPIDISTLQSPGGARSASPESDGDLVSVSVGRRQVSLKHDLGSIKGWIELVSER